jgi:hypothetical protein
VSRARACDHMSRADPSGDEKLAAFKFERDKLVAAVCSSERDALELLQGFMHRGYSAVAKNKEWAAKDKEKSTTFFRCEHGGCGFRLRLLRAGEAYRFALGQNNAAVHSGHALEKPGRTSSFAVSFLQQQAQELRGEGRTGLDLVTAIAKSAADIGVDVQATAINHARRMLEKAKLHSRVFEGVDTSFLLSLGDGFLDARSGDVDPAAAAVFGMLSKLQTQYRDAFLRVCVGANNVITYIFASLPRQRERGSLFGTMRLFDDKHGVSSSAYHLALCTVATNTGAEIVAWALMAHSDGASWHQFVRDCTDAFLSTKGGPARKWCLSITDGDGQIASAVEAVDSSVEHWTCWFHFKRLVRTKFLRFKDEWEPLHDVVDKLLYCDRENEYAALIADAREKISRFADGGLRDMHTAVLDEIVAFRLLARSTKFTNCWNSQSAAESMNAVMKRVGVGADMSLPIVLDKLIDHMERQERATDAWKPAAARSRHQESLQGGPKAVRQCCASRLRAGERHELHDSVKYV